MVSILAHNAIVVGSNPALGEIFTNFIIPMILVTRTRILYKLHVVWLLNLPWVCVCKCITCIYVLVIIR